MPIFFRTDSEGLPLFLDSVGNRWRQESIRRPKGHHLYHWMQTERGCGRVQAGGTELELKEGCGLLIAPGVPHSYQGISGEWRTSFATFSGTLCRDIGKITGGVPVLYADEREGAKRQAWVDEMVRRVGLGPQPDFMEISLECFSFLQQLSRLKNREDELESPAYAQYIAPVIKEIETNYSGPVTVESLAKSVYISPQYLSRLFGRFFGRSAYAYLTDFRMNKAKALLIQRPRLDVSFVAGLVGYNSPSHFIALFKQQTGYTPLEFRRMYG